MITKILRYSVIVMTALLVVAPITNAQEQIQPTLDIELNSLSKNQTGCRIDFVMHNRLASAIENLALEIVLFQQDGRIGKILSLKSGALPIGKTRVKRFRLKQCDDVVRILINDVTTCTGAGLTPKHCLQVMKTNNRTKIRFGL